MRWRLVLWGEDPAGALLGGWQGELPQGAELCGSGIAKI